MRACTQQESNTEDRALGVDTIVMDTQGQGPALKANKPPYFVNCYKKTIVFNKCQANMIAI